MGQLALRADYLEYDSYSGLKELGETQIISLELVFWYVTSGVVSWQKREAR